MLKLCVFLLLIFEIDCFKSFGKKSKTLLYKNIINAPYYVQIYNVKWNSTECSGVIIEKQWVLTAAQCFPYPATSINEDDYQIITGIKNKYTNHSDASIGHVEVKKIIIHEKYDLTFEPKIFNDVALIKLKKPLVFDDRVNSIQIRSTSVKKGLLMIRDVGNEENTTDCTHLESSVVPFVDPESCIKVFAKKSSYYESYKLPEDSICVGPNDENYCFEYSGIPVVDFNSELVGIMMGDDNRKRCRFGGTVPSVVISASYHIKWIMYHLRSVR